MESLRDIIQRIKANATVDRQPEEPEPEKCPDCEGLGWRRRIVRHGHPDFGELFPCKCTQSAVQNNMRVKWVDRANLPHGNPHTYENFIARPGSEQAIETTQRMATGNGPAILVVSGLTGSGKTHLAEAMVRLAIFNGWRARYEYVPFMLNSIRDAFGDGPSVDENLLRQYPVLALDEIGLRDKPTAWEQEKINELVELRLVNGLRTLIATNLLPE